MSFNENMNKIFESKQFATCVKVFASLIWIESGLVSIFPLPNATLRSQWAFGFLFGMLFMSMSTWVLSEIIQILCAKSPRINSFVERHWSDGK